MKGEKFTITSVLFSITGRYVIAPNASKEYVDRALKEIKECLVYNYVMHDISPNLRGESDGTLDYDPILRRFLCSKNRVLNSLVHKIDETINLEINPVIDQNYYLEIEKINKEDYLAYSYVVKEQQKIKSIRKREIYSKKTCNKTKTML